MTRETVRLVEEFKPDVAVMDVSMPLRNGIETARLLTRRAPETRVLVLSMYSDEAYVTQMLKAGPIGYLLKDSAGVDPAAGRRGGVAGKGILQPDGGLADVRRLRAPAERQRGGPLRIAVGARARNLSARGRRKDEQEKRALLFISPSTVETHRARIMEKIDLHSAGEIVLYAVRRRVIR